ILGMEEQHGFVVGTEPWLAVPEHPGACGAQPIAGSDDVVDLVAEVVHTAVGVALEKAAHWRIYAEGLEQLDPRVRQFDEHHGYPMRRQGTRLRDAGRERIPIEPARGREIGDDNGHMV